MDMSDFFKIFVASLIFSSTNAFPHTKINAYYIKFHKNCQEKLLPKNQWSPTGKPVVPKNHTHLRQGFGGSSAGQRNPPKRDTLIVALRSRALTHSSPAQ